MQHGKRVWRVIASVLMFDHDPKLRRCCVAVEGTSEAEYVVGR